MQDRVPDDSCLISAPTLSIYFLYLTKSSKSIHFYRNKSICLLVSLGGIRWIPHDVREKDHAGSLPEN